MSLLQIKTADPFHAGDVWYELKFHVNPITPLAFAQNKARVLNLDFRYGFQWIDGNREGLRGRWRCLAKRVIRPNQPSRHLRVLHPNWNNLPAFHGAHARHGIVRVKRKCSIGSAQIRCTHARQRVALRFHRRKICGNAKDGVGDAVIVEDFPERFPMAQLFCRATPQRNNPPTQIDLVLRRFYARNRKIRLHRGRITMNEVKDTVSPGIHAGYQIGPCHRTLRRNAGCKRAERSGAGKRGEVRHLALCHKLP